MAEPNHPPFVEIFPSLQQMRANKPQNQQQSQSPISQEKQERQYINQNEQLELEILRLKNDTAWLFADSQPAPQPAVPVYQPPPQQQKEALDLANLQIEKLRQEIQEQINQLKSEKNVKDESELSRRISNIQLFLFIEQLEAIDCPEPYNFTLRFKYYGMSLKYESQVQTQMNPYFGLNISSPLTLDIVKKMEHVPWILELWNSDLETGHSQLVGISKLDLSGIPDSLNSNLKIEKASLYPIIIYDDAVPVETLAQHQQIGSLTVKLAYGTNQQIARYQKQIHLNQIERERLMTSRNEEPNEYPPEVTPQDQPPSKEEQPRNPSHQSNDLIDFGISQQNEDENASNFNPDEPLSDRKSQQEKNEESINFSDRRVIDNFYKPISYGRGDEPPKIQDLTKQYYNNYISSYKNRISIRISSLINYKLEKQDYSLQIHFWKLQQKETINYLFVEDRVSNIDFAFNFTFNTRVIANQGTPQELFFLAIEDSQVGFILLHQNNIIAQGFLPSDEITDMPVGFNEIKFVSLCHNEELARLQLSLQYTIEQIAEPEAVIQTSPKPPVQEVIPITQSIIKDIPSQLLIEELYTILIKLDQIQWITYLKERSDQFRVIVQVEDQRFDKIVPTLESGLYPTRVQQDIQKINVELRYQIKCDPQTITTLSKSNLLLSVEYFYKSQLNLTLKGRVNLQDVFNHQGVSGGLPMFSMKKNVEELLATLTLEAGLEDKEPTQSIESRSRIEIKSQSRYYLKIFEVIIMMFEEQDLDEIYLRISDPIDQSQSYPVQTNGSAKIDTQDCIFQLYSEPMQTELELVSISLGEQRVLGRAVIETNHLIEEIKSEQHYQVLQSEDPTMSIRVGVKIISINYDEDSLNSRSVDQVFGVFQPEHLNKLKYIVTTHSDILGEVRQYMRHTMKLSFSEINFFINLIDNENLQLGLFKTFSDSVVHDQAFILYMQRAFTLQEQNFILDLQREFIFFDNQYMGFIEQKHVRTVLGYFNIDTDDSFVKQAVNLFIPAHNLKNFEDPYVIQIQRVNQFDYVGFLNFIQSITLAFKPLFTVCGLGPVQHQIQEVMKSYSGKKEQIDPNLNDHQEDNQQTTKIPDPKPKEPQRPNEPEPDITKPKDPFKQPDDPPKRPDQTQPKQPKSQTSSSQPPKEHTNSSGTKLQNAEKKINQQADTQALKRMEEIIQRNQFNFSAFDDPSSSDDDY